MGHEEAWGRGEELPAVCGGGDGVCSAGGGGGDGDCSASGSDGGDMAVEGLITTSSLSSLIFLLLL